jgi:hypothetical protein
MVAVTYKTHFLLGIKTGGAAYEVARWEFTPTGAQVKEKTDCNLSSYNEFVLVTPVGDTHSGTYVSPYAGGDCCG